MGLVSLEHNPYTLELYRQYGGRLRVRAAEYVPPPEHALVGYICDLGTRSGASIAVKTCRISDKELDRITRDARQRKLPYVVVAVVGSLRVFGPEPGWRALSDSLKDRLEFETYAHNYRQIQAVLRTSPGPDHFWGMVAGRVYGVVGKVTDINQCQITMFPVPFAL